MKDTKEVKQGICVYCDKNTKVKEWAETKELVCFDCRTDLLEQEFFEPDKSYVDPTGIF